MDVIADYEFLTLIGKDDLLRANVKEASSKKLELNLGFNWGDSGLVCMGIHTSPYFNLLKYQLTINLGFNGVIQGLCAWEYTQVLTLTLSTPLKINLGFNWGDSGLV
jgi:hypothetical protein